MFDGALIASADPVDLRRGGLDEVPAEAAQARSAIGRALGAGISTSGRGSASRPSRNARAGRRRSTGRMGIGRVIGSSSIPSQRPGAYIVASGH